MVSSQGGSRTLVPAIALPKGGGALHGIGEKFQINAMNGTGAFTVPIALSRGRGDSGPTLALAYDSGAGNGPFGLGWSVGIPSISRKTQKGLPRYEDERDIFVLAGAEDLVPVLRADGTHELITDDAYTDRDGARHIVSRYRPRIEGTFARIERWVRQPDGETHWRMITGDNVTALYGPTASSRIADGVRVFEWLLERTYDDKGNVVVYEYKPEDTVGVDPARHSEAGRLRGGGVVTQRYPKRVRYGNSLPYLVHRSDFARTEWERDNRWHFEVVFDYGEHVDGTPAERGPWSTRRDPFSTSRAGFEVRTYRLCHRILMFHCFDEPMLVRSTELSFEPSPIATQLVELTHVAHEPGHDPAPTPGVRFAYSRATVDDRVATVAGEELPVGVRWLDLDGEGVTGALAQHDGAWFYQRGEGEGRFSPPAVVASVPSFGGGGELMDLAGNGRLDLVFWSPEIAGSFERTSDAMWRPFVPFERVPNLDWNDPRVRLIDLTGDGLADVLVTEEDCFVWYPSEGAAGFGSAQRVAKALDEEQGPAIVFADETESIVLADMCGDGLTAIVRIRNGEVCYWPNTGYGTFGAKITMDNPPYFDDPSVFDPRRIRLGDIDGTGTTDLLYVGDEAIRFWRNQAGNSWGEEQTIRGLPRVVAPGTVQLVDLLGRGTACLVWTSELPSDVSVPVRYLPLMSGGKPYLLEEVDNGMGAVTKIQYTASTEFYLRDRREGTPWITTLPFPVHVVQRVETVDAISGNRFVSVNAYHHGFFDSVEREFRGFGMVEQWDTEEYGDDLHVPPVHTKTWFHTGFFDENESVSRHYEHEYYAGDPDAWLLTDNDLPDGLSAAEQREACRALKGRMLRREVYALDDDEVRREHPYSVVESKHHIRLEQPRTHTHHAVFYVCDCETLTYHYEREPSDPRITHTHTLELDAYGTVRKQATIAYPRRRGVLPEQLRMHVAYSEVDPIHLDTTPFTYRIRLPFEQRTYEIRNATHLGPWPKRVLAETIRAARDVPFTAPAGDTIDRRLLSRTRTRYYRDNLDPDDPLPFGQATPLAIPHEQHAMVFAQDILDLPELGGRFTPDRLRDAGYRNDIDDDPTHWWTASGTPLFQPTRAPAMFYLPSGARDAFGAESTIVHDEPRFLFPTEVTDPAGNTTSAEYDYRVLAPVRVTDPNGNRVEVVFDTRGMVIATAVMGKGSEGDSVFGFRREAATGLLEITTDPRRYLQGATTFFHYDLLAWRRDRRPAYAVGLSREVHVADEAGTPSPVQITVSYSDGFGRTILAKAQAEDGLAPVYTDTGELADELAPTSNRWVGNGATIFNNKGLPVRTYEPFFDSRPDYTDTAALVRIGHSPTLHYDPLGRVVRTEFPDGTHARVQFDPWTHVTFDAIDTVLASDWYAERQHPDTPPAQRAAADRAAVHDATPARAYLDTLGRPFVTVVHNKRRAGDALVDEFIPARTDLDCEGHTLAIFDGRGCEGLTLDQAITHIGNTVMTYVHAMGGLVLHESGMDAGSRWLLVDVAGKSVHAWDGRGIHTLTTYDRLQRPTQARVTSEGTTITAMRIYYGDELLDAEARARNLRGKPFLVFDGAGAAIAERCDFKGNVIASTRRLVAVRRLTSWPLLTSIRPDWSSLGSAPSDALTTPLLEAESFMSTSVFDALNRATSVTTPDGTRQTRRFNKARLLETVVARRPGADEDDGFVDSVDYNARGQRLSIQYANGVSTTYTYDEVTFRLVRLQSDRAGPALQDLHLVFDPVGNISEIRDDAIEPVYFRNQRVEATSSYTYDSLYRLVDATGRELVTHATVPTHVDSPPQPQIPATDEALQNYRQLYDYDPAGNITRLQHIASRGRFVRDFEYHADSNRLRATDSDDLSRGTYSHDVNGNLLEMPHLTRMDWDHTSHLAHVSIAPHDDVVFAYDGQRQRVRKVRIKDNRITERIYLGGYELYRSYLVGDEEPDEELATVHVMDGTTRICMIETPAGGAPRFRFQLGNHLGSATTELDEDGEVISYEEYHPYGTTSYRARNATIEVSAKRYRYTGMERDEETGLNYHAARYYASWLTRWLSTDPNGFVDSQNLYIYSQASPIAMSDTNGLDANGRDAPWDQISFPRLGVVAHALITTAYLANVARFAPQDLPYVFLERSINHIVDNVNQSPGPYPVRATGYYSRPLYGQRAPDITHVAHGPQDASYVWEIKARNAEAFEQGHDEVERDHATLRRAFSRPHGNAPWRRGFGVEGTLYLHANGYVYRLQFNQSAPPARNGMEARGVINYRFTRSRYRHREIEDAFSHEFISVSAADLNRDIEEIEHEAGELIPVMMNRAWVNGARASGRSLNAMSTAIAVGGLAGVVAGLLWSMLGNPGAATLAPAANTRLVELLTNAIQNNRMDPLNRFMEQAVREAARNAPRVVQKKSVLIK